MASIDKLFERLTIKKRDKAYDQLIFFEKYPEVFAADIDKKNEKILAKIDLKLRKRLLPLEIAAAPEAEVNSWRADRELKKYLSDFELKRRAVEQVFIRANKSGNAQANANREKSLNDLDAALAKYKIDLERKYPQNLDSKADEEAVKRFKAAESRELAAFESVKSQLDSDKKNKVNALNSRLNKQKAKAKFKFDHASRHLHDSPHISKEAFGKETILKIQNLKMHFGSVKAVDDISFDIKEGEIFGLIGPNGAGKTTLFNCITQFYKPTGGNAFYRDRFGNIIDLVEYRTHDIVKTGIARTFQNLELVLGLPVIGNLLIGSHISYRSSLFDQFFRTRALLNEESVNIEMAREILARLNLTEYMMQQPKGLPYGVLKKVELARTLMTKPRLIILDEPAAGLNDAETEELTEIIRKIRDDYKCTIFLVEHDMNLVMNVCDTICATSFGKLLAMGSPEEIQQNPLVQEAYLGMKEDEN